MTEPNNEEWTHTDHSVIEELQTPERLAGVEGHLRRLDRGHAEREPEQGGDTDSATASPIGGQGTGELSALVRQWEKEAAAGREQAALMSPLMGPIAEALTDLAAVCDRHARELLAAIGDPRPQSGEDGAEEQRRCTYYGYRYCADVCHNDGNYCSACPRRGKREERSVPPIDRAVAAADPNPQPSNKDEK